MFLLSRLDFSIFINQKSENKKMKFRFQIYFGPKFAHEILWTHKFLGAYTPLMNLQRADTYLTVHVVVQVLSLSLCLWASSQSTSTEKK